MGFYKPLYLFERIFCSDAVFGEVTLHGGLNTNLIKFHDRLLPKSEKEETEIFISGRAPSALHTANLKAKVCMCVLDCL